MTIEPFGTFLLSKKLEDSNVGVLAQAAARDPKFPRNGTPEDVSKILLRHEAPYEFHEALEEAETEWRNLARH
jgi:hypothetical protein